VIKRTVELPVERPYEPKCTSCVQPVQDGGGWQCPECLLLSHRSCASILRTCPHCRTAFSCASEDELAHDLLIVVSFLLEGSW
jgi:hypothetical protein